MFVFEKLDSQELEKGDVLDAAAVRVEERPQLRCAVSRLHGKRARFSFVRFGNSEPEYRFTSGEEPREGALPQYRRGLELPREDPHAPPPSRV